MPGDVTDLDQELAAILAPLRSKRDAIDAELEQLDVRRLELRDARTRINRLLGANNHKKPGPKAGSTPARRQVGVATERQDELLAWVKKHYAGKEFSAPEISDRKDFAPLEMVGSYLNNALNSLQSRGALRLVRTGHPDYGNRTKIWRVTNT